MGGLHSQRVEDEEAVCPLQWLSIRECRGRTIRAAMQYLSASRSAAGTITSWLVDAWPHALLLHASTRLGWAQQCTEPSLPGDAASSKRKDGLQVTIPRIRKFATSRRKVLCTVASCFLQYLTPMAPAGEAGTKLGAFPQRTFPPEPVSVPAAGRDGRFKSAGHQHDRASLLLLPFACCILYRRSECGCVSLAMLRGLQVTVENRCGF